MTEKVDLSYELAQIKQLVKDHDIAVSEMRGNDAEGIRFQIADACQDFVLGSLVSLESALADQRRMMEAEAVQLTASEAHTIGWWPEGSGKRVAVVLLDQEGE